MLHSTARQGGRVLMLTLRAYPQSPVVNRNVEFLLDQGFHVDLIHLAPTSAPWWMREKHPRLRRFRVPIQHRRTHAIWYVVEYSTFFLAALAIVCALGLRYRYAAVHVDNLPDGLVFATLLPRLRGARVLLNICDPMPELTATRLDVDAGHPAVRMASLLERWSARWADQVTVPNEEPCRRLVVGRGTPESKVRVLPNTLPAEKHAPSLKPGPPVLLCLGTLLERYGVHIAIDALDLLRWRWPTLTIRVIGSGEYSDQLQQRADALGLADRVEFCGFLPWPQAMAEVRRGTIGIVSHLADGYGELITPTKLLDYVQQGLPCVCSRLPGVEGFFPPDSLVYFEPGSPTALAAAVDRLLSDPEAAIEMAGRAQEALSRFSWERIAPCYLEALGVAPAG